VRVFFKLAHVFTVVITISFTSVKFYIVCVHAKYAILIPMILSTTVHVTVVQMCLEIGSFMEKYVN
jgi:hypothetical protein